MLFFLILIFSILPDIVAQKIINVPGDYISIQDGIDAAHNQDTILVGPGRYFENINFRGKAITVASHFILDHDTSFITSTIINGSRAVNPDSASTVFMVSGEDSTSLLCGFTITGGSGSNVRIINKNDKAGGGILVYNSGGCIQNNLIAYNFINHHRGAFVHGGGIYCGMFDDQDHHFICSDNIIRNNAVFSSRAPQGGGIAAAKTRGSILIQNNTITNNKVQCSTNRATHGGGITTRYHVDKPGAMIIRNNIISNNELLGNPSYPRSDPLAPGYRPLSGGGIAVVLIEEAMQMTDLSPYPLIYWNTIDNNHSDGRGGAIGIVSYHNRQPGSVICPKPLIAYNKITDNSAMDGSVLYNIDAIPLMLENDFGDLKQEAGFTSILDLKQKVFVSKDKMKFQQGSNNVVQIGRRYYLNSDDSWLRISGLHDPENLSVKKLPPLWLNWWAFVLYGTFIALILLIHQNMSRKRKKLYEQFKRDFILDISTSDLNTASGGFLKEVIETIEANIAEEYFSVEWLSTKLNLSRTQLFRKIRAQTGMSPQDLIRNTKLKLAAKRFEEGQRNVARVMYDVGFNTPSYFTERFRELYGLNPTDYIKTLQHPR